MDHGDHNAGDCDSDDDDDYSDIFESIKTKTGLEIGCKIKWPVAPPPPRATDAAGDDTAIDATPTTAVPRYIELELSTCLPEECIAPMFDGTQWAGTRVWRAAVVALQYLLGQHYINEVGSEHRTDNGPPKRPMITRKTTVLELGCGLGVPGMILHAATGCSTVVTDKDDLVHQLRQNLNTNFATTGVHDGSSTIAGAGAGAGAGTGTIQAQPLDWSIQGVQTLLSTVQLSHFDVVLNADCIYEPLYGQSWRLLLQCQEELLRAANGSGSTYMLTCCERRRADGVDSYLEAARASAVISRVERVCIPFSHSSSIELYRLHGV